MVLSVTSIGRPCAARWAAWLLAVLMAGTAMAQDAPPPLDDDSDAPAAAGKKAAPKAPEKIKPSSIPQTVVSKRPMKDSQGRDHVLVLDLKPQGVAANVAKNISGLLVVSVGDFSDYAMISMADVNEILDTRAKEQLLGCDKASCYAEFGDRLGARFMVYGTVGEVGGKYLINLNLVDAVEATAVNRVQVVVEEKSKLVEFVRRAAAQLFRKEYTRESESFIVQKKFVFIQFGGLGHIPFDGAVSAGMGGKLAAYFRANDFLMGPEINFFWTRRETMLSLTGTDVENTPLEDHFFVTHLNARVTYNFLLDTEYISPYVGLAGGVQLVLNAPGGSKDNEEILRDIAPLKATRETEAQVGWNVQPVVGAIFFPTTVFSFYTEARMVMGASYQVRNYRFDMHRGVGVELVDVSPTGLQLGLGVNLAF